MKFDVEITKTLHGYNAEGSKVALSVGDEVYLKLDLPHMKIWDQEKWIQRYPDGWIKCRIHSISNAGQRIYCEVLDKPGHYLIPRQKHILDVSDKAPKEELK